MALDTKYNFKRKLSNFFGALGYFACLMQWFWAVMLYSSILKSAIVYFSPNTNEVVTKADAVVSSGPNMLSVIFAVIVTIFVLILTIYVLIKMPSTIIKTSKKAVSEAAEGVAPIVLKVQHKKDTKKNHIKLTAQIIVVIKIILIIVPTCLTFASQLLKTQIFGFYIAIFVGVWLAVFTVVFFILQYVIAKAFAVNVKDLW